MNDEEEHGRRGRRDGATESIFAAALPIYFLVEQCQGVALGGRRLSLDQFLGRVAHDHHFSRQPRTRRRLLSPSGESSVEMEVAGAV